MKTFEEWWKELDIDGCGGFGALPKGLGKGKMTQEEFLRQLAPYGRDLPWKKRSKKTLDKSTKVV